MAEQPQEASNPDAGKGTRIKRSGWTDKFVDDDASHIEFSVGPHPSSSSGDTTDAGTEEPPQEPQE